MECVAAVVLAVILFATGLGIGWSGTQKIFFMNSDSLEVPGMLALIAALVSIVTKEWMYWFTKFTADKIRSDALRADAWHHRSDALSSIGALIGIGGARLGFPVLDPIASVVICLFILKAAIDVFRDAVDKMVDKSCDRKDHGGNAPGHLQTGRRAGHQQPADQNVRLPHLCGCRD